MQAGRKIYICNPAREIVSNRARAHELAPAHATSDFCTSIFHLPPGPDARAPESSCPRLATSGASGTMCRNDGEGTASEVATTRAEGPHSSLGGPPRARHPHPRSRGPSGDKSGDVMACHRTQRPAFGEGLDVLRTIFLEESLTLAR